MHFGFCFALEGFGIQRIEMDWLMLMRIASLQGSTFWSICKIGKGERGKGEGVRYGKLKRERKVFYYLLRKTKGGRMGGVLVHVTVVCLFFLLLSSVFASQAQSMLYVCMYIPSRWWLQFDSSWLSFLS